MACEQERHVVELAERLVGHYREQMDEADEHLQDLLESIPGACQHVGIPKLSGLVPSRDGETYFLDRPIRTGPRRELNEACFDAIQAYYDFRMIDIYRTTSLWLKASDMLERFNDKLEKCEHGSKHE